MAPVRYSLILIALLLCSVVALADPASDQEIERKTHQVFDNVMSPFCPGKTLNDCPSGEAAKLKSTLRDKLIQGSQPEQLIEELVTQYGDELRAAPANEGFGRVAWLGPLIFFSFGALGLIVWLVRKRNQ